MWHFRLLSGKQLWSDTESPEVPKAVLPAYFGAMIVSPAGDSLISDSEFQHILTSARPYGNPEFTLASSGV